jgi:hypothetical protein
MHRIHERTAAIPFLTELVLPLVSTSISPSHWTTAIEPPEVSPLIEPRIPWNRSAQPSVLASTAAWIPVTWTCAPDVSRCTRQSAGTEIR